LREQPLAWAGFVKDSLSQVLFCFLRANARSKNCPAGNEGDLESQVASATINIKSITPIGAGQESGENKL
jgi:hypothetical protein